MKTLYIADDVAVLILQFMRKKAKAKMYQRAREAKQRKPRKCTDPRQSPTLFGSRRSRR